MKYFWNDRELSEMRGYVIPCYVCGKRGDTAICSDRCANEYEAEQAAEAYARSVEEDFGGEA